MSSELSALLHAVKKRDRTDQYIILAALFGLRAHSKPVTVAQVRDSLELLLGNETPRNISRLLRRCGGSARPVEKGPPMLWELTTAGLEELRQMSGKPLVEDESSEFASDVAIICALEDPEFIAVMNAFGGTSKWSDVGAAHLSHLYRSTEMVTKGGAKISIYGTTASAMGLTAAAIATTQLILKFRPRVVVMVGIAAGTRSGNKEFGDVLVADPSVDYNSGKVSAENGIREFLPDPYPIGLHPKVRSLLLRYHQEHPAFSRIRSRWKGALPSTKNKLFIGPVGAADQVIDDESMVRAIQSHWRKLIGVEMETYAVYRACHEAPEPKPLFVSFKAVCDFAAQKTDSWQKFAAFTAAEFAAEFLSNDWESMAANRQKNIS